MEIKDFSTNLTLYCAVSLYFNVTKPQKLADSHILQFKTVDNAWVLQQQEMIIIDMEDLVIGQAQKVDQWPTMFGESNSVKSLHSFIIRIAT